MSSNPFMNSRDEYGPFLIQRHTADIPYYCSPVSRQKIDSEDDGGISRYSCIHSMDNVPHCQYFKFTALDEPGYCLR